MMLLPEGNAFVFAGNESYGIVQPYIALYAMGDPTVTESYLAWIMKIFSYGSLTQVTNIQAIGMSLDSKRIVIAVGP
jgi:hypothetical protein